MAFSSTFGYEPFQNVGSPNPWQQAMSSINDVQNARASSLANQLSETKLPYIGPTMQAQLTQMQLDNQKNQELMKYADPMAAAQLKIAQAKANNPFLDAAGIGGQMGILGQLEQQNPNDPRIQMMKDFINSQIQKNVGMGKYYGSNSWAKYMPHSLVNEAISGNYQQFPVSGSDNQGSAKDSNNLYDSLNTDIPVPNSSNNTQSSSINNPQSIRDVAASSVIKETTPAKIQEQRAYSGQAAALYNRMGDLLPSVKKFTGASGTIDRINSHIGSIFGRNDPDYNNLLLFEQDSPLLANELRRQIGGQATDTEKATIEELSAPDLRDKTPDQLQALFDNIGKILNKSGSVLARSQSQTQSQLGNEANVNNNSSKSKSKLNDPLGIR